MKTVIPSALEKPQGHRPFPPGRRPSLLARHLLRSLVWTGWALILLLGLLGSPESARAGLGTAFSAQEAAHLGYSRVVTATLPGPLTAYTLSRTATNPLGHAVTERIREVAGPDGRIFALSWSTIHHPDLNLLLGKRLPSSLPFIRGERTLSLPTLELRMGGSVLHSEGMAWDPRRLPPGINLQELLTLP